MLNYDDTLFSGLDLPEEIDKDLLVETILMRGGEYEVIYSDLDFLKEAITSWSRQWKPTFTEWCRAFEDLKEVAPLENYDRIENWSDSTSNSENESLSTSEQSSGSESSRGSSSTSGSDSSQGSESMIENSGVSAYDVSTYSPAENGSKNASTSTNGTTYTEQGNTQTSNRSSNASGSEARNKAFNQTFTHGGRIHGNIGVLTSTAMYKEWVSILQSYGNIYDRVATVFLQNFVIPIL